jgi:hypothetical protein
LRKSYLAHRTIKLPALKKEKRPHRSQSIKRHPARKPAPVKAPPPSKE